MWKDPKTQNGQTLIEAVVTLAVAVVIISSIVTLVNSSNRRSNISRQATQASKLAQQGMEIVRNIRDVNDSDAMQVGRKAGPILCSAAAPCPWSELYTERQLTQPAVLAEPGDAGCPGAAESWCLVGVNPEEAILLDIFSRTVEISDVDLPTGVICGDPDSGISLDYDETKRVVVRVEWDSPTGRISRSVISCITNWR